MISLVCIDWIAALRARAIAVSSGPLSSEKQQAPSTVDHGRALDLSCAIKGWGRLIPLAKARVLGRIVE